MQVDILAIGVHPDDIELCCSGTLIKHIKLGYSVGLCDLTQGELGTRGSAALRLQEAEKARETMGAAFRVNLKMPDGFVEENKENLLKIIEVIRMCAPTIILANAISDRHPDHGRASTLIRRAAFLSGLTKIETEKDGVLQDAHRPELVLCYIQDRHIQPDVLIDISDCIEEKMNVIKCFRSQFFEAETDEPETPISGKDFLEYVRNRDQVYGRQIQADFAEGFTSEKYLGVTNLFHLR